MSGGTWSKTSLHLGPDAWITCHTYPETAPILVLSGGDADLAVSACQRTVSESDVKNAQALVEAATTYLSEVERLHGQTAPGAHGRERAA